jgi:hypothetical protein
MGSAQGAHGSEKKSLENALDEIQNTGRTSHPLFVNVSMARKVNAVCGYGAVSPWEVGELTEEWLNIFDGLYDYEKEKAEKSRQEDASKDNFERVLARKRAEHPSYRKY